MHAVHLRLILMAISIYLSQLVWYHCGGGSFSTAARPLSSLIYKGSLRVLQTYRKTRLLLCVSLEGLISFSGAVPNQATFLSLYFTFCL